MGQGEPSAVVEEMEGKKKNNIVVHCANECFLSIFQFIFNVAMFMKE